MRSTIYSLAVERGTDEINARTECLYGICRADALHFQLGLRLRNVVADARSGRQCRNAQLVAAPCRLNMTSTIRTAGLRLAPRPTITTALVYLLIVLSGLLRFASMIVAERPQRPRARTCRPLRFKAGYARIFFEF